MLFNTDGIKSENNYTHSDKPSGKNDKRSESNKNTNMGKIEYIDNQAIVTKDNGLIDYNKTQKMMKDGKPNYQFNESVNADLNTSNTFDPIKMSKDFKNIKRVTNTSY